MPDELVSTLVAAQLLQVSDETVRRWAADGLIRHIRMPSGQIRFRRSDLEAILRPIEPNDDSRRAS
jgi:excisionase family DNA binding protein